MGEEFGTILVVALILWTAFIGYAVYLDAKLRKLEEKMRK